ncbi:MAG: hypothetical protein CVU44_11365 [Chloroflexi bacterium HGW-Chloroflexi-6]|nr:MAG: hypothetical protein CVU44_11365 [Chloroflexi bacterium HGW-Chloroflexi-6]
MEKLLDGDDRAKEMGYPDYESFLTQHPLRARRGLLGPRLKPWNGKVADAPVLQAHISGGRWMVQCWCGAYSYVAVRRPIHWCMACGNGAINAALPVELPGEAERAEIERILLLRPVQAGMSGEPTQAAMQANPLVPGLRRDWFPGQSVDWLMEINTANGVQS